ncbi:hypothetical protein P691DRAFT_802768 [Macrolepiota fuliginosa MF-IS2]|uniref:Uncharacterized protein n=1 Tax=Macrolepiota fuliginosa MF-IS2 TaxID=1400762 RepID=A0A9P5XLG0_9AGAR|nr:hypothetical protein P691DRAFT_802768 [Macrolepiota fuliginosa MF-IS2]
MGQGPDTNPSKGTVPPPSSFARPTVVDDAPQQALTQPGGGTTINTDVEATQPSQQVSHPGPGLGEESPGKEIPFKEQVIGVAQKTRGTLLRKPKLKEHGEKILVGEATHEQDKKKK